MLNVINAQNFYQTLTTDTSVTLGAGSANTVNCPELLVITGSGSFTVYLPPINTIYANPPTTTQATTGVDSSFEIAINNQGGSTITIVPYGTDVTVPSTIIFPTSPGSYIRIRSIAKTSTWYQVGG